VTLFASLLVSAVQAGSDLAGFLPYVLAGFMLLALLMVVVGGLRVVRAARRSGGASGPAEPAPHDGSDGSAGGGRTGSSGGD